MIVLNYPGIKGECTDTNQKDWINVGSVQWGGARAITNPSGSSQMKMSTPTISEIAISRPSDSASPHIWDASLCGSANKEKVLLRWLQTAGAGKQMQIYIEIELTGAMITSYQVAVHGTEITESFSINFTELGYQYNAFSGDTVTTGTKKKWDVIKNVQK